MTTTTTRTLRDELDRLNAEANDLAEKLANADRDSHGAKLLTADARDIDQAGKGVAHLIDEYGDEATVEIRGMTAGWHARVQDLADSMDAGAQNVYAAAGIVDAPFVSTDGDDDEALKARARTVADLPVGVRSWIENVMEDVSYGGSGNWEPFSERLATALQQD